MISKADIDSFKSKSGFAINSQSLSFGAVVNIKSVMSYRSDSLVIVGTSVSISIINW